MCFTTQPTAAEKSTSSRDIEQQLAIGKTLLDRGSYEAAQHVFESILQTYPHHGQAKQLLKQAKRHEAAQQTDAVKIADQFAREKANTYTAKEAQAKQQLKLARERQMKLLYNKGLALYNQGSYKAAIDTLQQMALLDPQHPLVLAAEKLVAKAELRRSDQLGRLRAQFPSQPDTTKLSELEDMLTVKRLEQETLLKYAKLSIQQKNYDRAIDLYQRVLADDPTNENAQQLLQQVQTAKLQDEHAKLQRRVSLDEQTMLNDVTRAEVIDPHALQPTASAQPVKAPGMESVVGSPKFAQPISFDFQDVAFEDVLDFLADSASISIIPSPRLDAKQKRVSLHVDQLPLGLALKYLVKNLGLDYRVEENVVLIASPEEFESEPLETRVFYLNTGLGPLALETSAVEPGTALKMTSLKDLIDQIVTQPAGSKLVIDERSGSIVVTNTGENLRKIEQVLSQLDNTPVQVLIEARFIEVNVTDLRQVGLESVLTGDYSITKKGVGLPDGSSSRDPGNIVAKNSGFKFPNLNSTFASRESEGFNLTLQTVLNTPRFEMALHLLEESQKSKTLSSPRITALNNQPASIKVVDEFQYPTRYEVSLVQFDINGDGDFDDAGETEFVNVPQDFQKRDIGILLNVTPSVSKDLRTITLVLAPEVSEFSQFRDLGGGVSVPDFTSSQLTTSVTMQDGQTVVLGGLMKDSDSELMTKVPVLGDLPLFGAMFRQKEKSQTRKNLLIFVTARVLAPRGKTI